MMQHIAFFSLIVTPAKAGAQGNRQSLASGKAVKPAMCSMRPWFPAFAGMTKKRAGMTKKRAGMTEKGVGMTEKGRV